MNKNKQEVWSHYGSGHQALCHTLIIENGVVVDAYITQVLGNYRSSGGWERSVIGQHIEDLDLTEYRKMR